VATYIQSNYVPVPFVIMLLVQFLSMVVDRLVRNTNTTFVVVFLLGNALACGVCVKGFIYVFMVLFNIHIREE